MQKSKLTAEFILNENQVPQYFVDKGLKHYKIRLYIEDPPEDTYAVTYLLHDSYYDHRREKRNRQDNFREDLTTYGDYLVRARIRRKHGVDMEVVELSRALEARHRDLITSNAAIRDAIKAIKSL